MHGFQNRNRCAVGSYIGTLPLDITGMSETEIAESRKVNQHISSAYDEFA